jgi:hypothetical protein
MKLKTKQYRKPSALDEYTLRKAATLWARADSANPFAFRQAMLHMRQGYELPSEVIETATNRLAARGQKAEYLA